MGDDRGRTCGDLAIEKRHCGGGGVRYGNNPETVRQGWRRRNNKPDTVFRGEGGDYQIKKAKRYKKAAAKLCRDPEFRELLNASKQLQRSRKELDRWAKLSARIDRKYGGGTVRKRPEA